MLHTLEYKLNSPTAQTFLERFSHVAGLSPSTSDAAPPDAANSTFISTTATTAATTAAAPAATNASLEPAAPESLAAYLCELSLTDYSMLWYKPSTIGAACVELALSTLSRPAHHARLLRSVAGYPEGAAAQAAVRACCHKVLALQQAAAGATLQASYRKYASEKLAKVSTDITALAALPPSLLLTAANPPPPPQSPAGSRQMSAPFAVAPTPPSNAPPANPPPPGKTPAVAPSRSPPSRRATRSSRADKAPARRA